MVDQNLKNKIDNISARPIPGQRIGNCDRCKDFGNLKKTPWENPETMTAGFGWLCDECFDNSESANRLRHQYSLSSGHYLVTDLGKSYHPVPKPVKRDKKSKT